MISISALRQFNWVDICVVIILIRIGYVAMRTGLPVELFKLLGTLSAIYLSCHYYSRFSDFLAARIGSGGFVFKFLDIFSFLIFAMAGYLVFVLLRSLVYRFMKLEATPRLNQWGGFLLGAGRAILAASLIILILAVSPLGYLKHSVKNAYSGGYLLKTATNTYSFLYNGIISKFAANEKFNIAIINVQAGIFQQ